MSKLQMANCTRGGRGQNASVGIKGPKNCNRTLPSQATPVFERYTSAMKILQKILTFTLASACVAASAQWQWIDKDGHKVFSDRAPPADILDKNILKRPAGKLPAVTPALDTGAAADAASPAAAPPAGNGGKSTGVDKDLEAKKKQTADAEAAKRKAEEERITKAKIENCARAKQAKTTFDSGIRISRTNAAGEREIMDDAARAAEAKRIQSVIDTDCK